MSRFLFASLLSLFATHCAFSADLTFNDDIRPILADHCFACHGVDSESRAADLRLDVRQEAIDFGAIVPGDSKASTLVERIFEHDEEVIMPPPETKKPLSEEQKKKLVAWIDSGAEYQKHWAFEMPEAELILDPEDTWSKGEIDRFIFAKLKAEGLSPNPQASPNTIVRRLSLDIRGLPPTPAEVQQFVDDFATDQDAAVDKWIDRFMSSSAWGEHRGRYWLDAARYADTHGLHFDNYREMYPYRDWVIRAFNDNKPFDEFTIEQLAGDLLENPTTDQLVATGFQRCNITTNEGGTIDAENLALYAQDRVQTFGWVYLGLTTNCCQCHDHKFDPLTTKDFYSLAAFFRNTTQPAKDGNVKDGRSATVVVPSEADQPRWQDLPDEIKQAEKAVGDYRAAARPAFDKWIATLNPGQFEGQGLSQGLQVRLPLVAKLPKDKDARKQFDRDGVLGPARKLTPEYTVDLGAALGNFEISDKFSVSVWVKPKGNRGGGIITKMDIANKHRGWDLWQNGNNYSVHLIDTWPDNALKISTKARTVKPGKWQHLTITWDGSGKPQGLKFYIDGKSVPTQVDSQTFKQGSSIRSQVPLRIGKRTDGENFEGAVQDLNIFTRQLTSKQVSQLAARGLLQTIATKDRKTWSAAETKRMFDFYLANEDAGYAEVQGKLASLQAEREAILARSPITHVQREKNEPAMANILMRGAYDKPGEEVTAAPPAALHPMAEGLPANRLGLAKWVIDRRNPLTARVTVNRFWQEVFGQGIVTTTEDFGIMGAKPANQQLLDWLAVDFQEHGWDVKRLFRQMLSSAAYRQSSATDAEKLELDRENAFVSRGPYFRLDAEVIRDYALASSGLLQNKMYGAGTKPYQPTNIWDVVGLPSGNTRVYQQDTGENLYRRSLYNFWKRMAPPPSLEALNAPSREVCVVRRERTNTPLQALVTLNDVQFIEAARALAELGINSVKDKDSEIAILNVLSMRVLSRNFQPREMDIAIGSVEKLRTHYKQDVEAANQLINAGESKPDPSIDASELAAWTMLCNQLLNLDEALSK